jgi:hypothetical protein
MPANFLCALNSMEDTIVFSPLKKKYWKDHSPILHDYFEEMEEDEGKEYDILERENLVYLSDAQWKLLKNLVEQDESAFGYGPSGTPYLNTGKGYTLSTLKDLLDYLGYDTPKTMMASITKYAKNFKADIGHGITGATRGALKKKANENRARSKLLRRRSAARASSQRERNLLARWRIAHGLPENNNNNNNRPNNEYNEEIEKEILEEEAAKRDAARAAALRTRLRKSQKAKKYAPVNANTALRAKPLGRKSTLVRYTEKRPNMAHLPRGKMGKRGKTSKRERGSKKAVNNTNLIAELNNNSA